MTINRNKRNTIENYVHGYSGREAERLHDQANTLDELLHHDSTFPVNSSILETGCGVGAQTKIIAMKNPTCHFTSIDISESSITQATKLIESFNIKNVEFQTGDIFNLTFEDKSFDHIFVCFVLEHLSDPLHALHSLKRVLKPGGTMTVIEGDHGSAYFYPYSEAAQKAINCLIELQARNGGNSLIGRTLFPLLQQAGFSDCIVSPRMVYADHNRPDLVEGFTKNTFTAMIEGVKQDALHNGLVTEKKWEQGIRDLYRTAEEDGVFCYTFFKGRGTL